MAPVLRRAEDIAAQFRSYPPREAAEALARHIRLFWDPRMRAQLVEQVEAAGTRCDPTIVAAVDLLEKPGG